MMNFLLALVPIQYRIAAKMGFYVVLMLLATGFLFWVWHKGVLHERASWEARQAIAGQEQEQQLSKQAVLFEQEREVNRETTEKLRGQIRRLEWKRPLPAGCQLDSARLLLWNGDSSELPAEPAGKVSSIARAKKSQD